ncbi:Protein of uncharacterised function (DUF3558) [Nocardia africana]|uniref:Protein of uncharacterized function (DUF3558) n=1 Tax=Nocardia africana TaxID=134964 RepID=A0A378WKU6_9NOCA|nr:Protein of uncharacterised function (DUF3558) [Nocardia africana]
MINRRGRTVAARRLAIVLLAAVVPVLAACNNGGDGGNGSTTSAAAAKLWDPCTQIPDDALQKAGVDPASKESGIAGVHQSGWEICNWKGKRYTVNVLSGKRSLQEIQNKEGNVDFQDVVLAGRKGQQYRVEGASKNDTCDAVFAAHQGIVEIVITNSLIVDNPGDPCATLHNVGEVLVPLLPE